MDLAILPPSSLHLVTAEGYPPYIMLHHLVTAEGYPPYIMLHHLVTAEGYPPYIMLHHLVTAEGYPWYSMINFLLTLPMYIGTELYNSTYCLCNIYAPNQESQLNGLNNIVIMRQML